MKTNENRHKIFERLNAPINKTSREEKLRKYFDKLPHENLHDFHTIKWFRRRVDDDVFYRSINTMLPDNGKPYETEYEDLDSNEKYQYKFRKYLKSIQKPKSKFEAMNLLPKYLYSELTLTKIKKLKEIFLEFDEDLSRKLEIDEMVEMFKKNNIPVQKDELINLFFKGKDRKKLPKVPFLDFYQFMLFAINKESDQDFRNFMRKYKKTKEKDNRFSNTSDHKNDYDQGDMFLPMNFNLLLDYFNNKKEERDGLDKIKKAMDLMDHIMKADHFIENDKNSDTSGLNTERKFQIHKDINLEELLSEFEKLFKNNHSSDHNNYYTQRIHKKTQVHGTTDSEIEFNPEEGNRALPNLLNINNKNKFSYNNNNDSSSFNENQADEHQSGQLHVTRYLINKIHNQEIQKLTNRNYNKYKSIPLAVEETIKTINKDFNSRVNNFKSGSESSTFFTMNGNKNSGSNLNYNSNKSSANSNKIINDYGRTTNNFLIRTNLHPIQGKKLLKINKIRDKSMTFNNYTVHRNTTQQNKINQEITSKEDFIPLSFMKELYKR